MFVRLCVDDAKVQFESNSQQRKYNVAKISYCVLMMLRYNLKAIHNQKYIIYSPPATVC